MIKDEKIFIKQCLESIFPFVDEVVVCDTGSTDGTLEIVEELKKEHNIKLYHTPWRNDFSSHRNETISKASGDFVLIIDADEKIVAPLGFTKKHLKKWLKQVESKYNAIAITINDIQKGVIVMNCNSARLFKKDGIRYENKIHNSPVFDGPAVLNNDLLIQHFGYDISPERMKVKFDRTYSLLMEDLKDVDSEGNPKRVDTYFYLAQLLGHHGKNEESRRWGRKYLEMKDKIPQDKFNKTIYYTMIKSFHEEKLMDEAYKLIMEALKETPFDPDVCCAMADHGAMIRNHQLMLEGSRRYIRGYRELITNPALKCGQFYFSLKDEIVTLNLYRIVVASLQEGVEAWRVLKPRLDNTPADILDELETNLNVLGQTHLLKEIEHLYKQESKLKAV